MHSFDSIFSFCEVIRTVVRPTMKWMSQHGGNNIWLCTHNETGELLAVSVWLPPGVKVAIPFTKLVATSVSTFASVGVHGGKRVKNYFQVTFGLCVVFTETGPHQMDARQQPR